jgi:FkbM family methyltransferase
MLAEQLWRLALILCQFAFTLILVLVIVWLWSIVRKQALVAAVNALTPRESQPGEVHQDAVTIACAGASTPLQALCTPAGTQFLAFSRYEAHVLLHEMYHGSTDSRLQDSGFDSLPKGQKPYIVDVRHSFHPYLSKYTKSLHMQIGANIGLFSLWVKENFPGAHIIAVEALPPTAALLRANVKQTGSTDIHVYQCGAGSGTTENMQFEFTPGMSVGASSISGKAVMDEATQQAAVEGAGDTVAPPPATGLLATLSDLTVDVRRTFVEVQSSSGHAFGCAPAVRVLERLHTSGALLPQFQGTAPSDFANWWRMLSEIMPLMLVKSKHNVTVKRTSLIVAEHEKLILGSQRPVIDYLKVDVEGAEEFVLAGVSADDWKRTRNVMVEVHDAGGALVRVQTALKGHGFNVSTKQEVWRLHRRLGIYLIFGTRSKGWTAPTWCSQLTL